MNDTSTVTKSIGLADILWPEVSRVPLHGCHARVCSQFPVELVNGHVHGKNLARPILQQAIRETACGTPHIHADAVSWTQGEIFERAFELESSTACVTQRLTGNLNARIGGHLRAGLVYFRAVHADLPGEHQRLSALSRRRQSLRDEQQIEPFFSWFRLSFAWSAGGRTF